MNCDELLRKVSDASGIPLGDAKSVYESMAACILDALSKGENVNLMPELGSFVTKLNDNTSRNENSPRTPRNAVYKVRFHPAKKLQKRR